MNSAGPLAPLNQYVVSASNALGDYDLYFKNSPYAGNHPSADGGCSWSPNGRYIVFTSARSGGGDLYLIDTEQVDASPKSITNTPLAAEVYPTWSGDSKKQYMSHTPMMETTFGGFRPSRTHRFV